MLDLFASIAGGITADSKSTIQGSVIGLGIIGAPQVSGGVTNNGSINAGSGIYVDSVTTFAGGVANSGVINGGNGFAVSNISNFSGGVINAGEITASNYGISVLSITNFTGGISNDGSIISTGVLRAGIGIYNISRFTGGIVNKGNVSAEVEGVGIAIGDVTCTCSQVSNFSGGISNSGTVSGGYAGVAVFNPQTFSGGIVNTGTISGGYGIVLFYNGGVSIFNSGTITGTGLAAIQLPGPGVINTLTLGPGSVINGKVFGSGADIFQLGGTGSGFFDLSTVGSNQQYQGFTTFNVLSGTWSVANTFSQTQPWNINGGTLAGVGTLSSVNVNDGGTLAPGLPTVAGGALNIVGNLAMTSGATYLVNVSPNIASSTKISGGASVSGSLDANGTGGQYTSGTKYTVLTANGGRNGTFSSLSVTGSFGSMMPTLSYDANDVFLTLVPANLAANLPQGASQNVVNVANALTAANVGTPSLAFQNLFNLSPSQLTLALTQLEGQNNAGGAQQAGYQLMNEFLLLMLNPFDSDRSGFGGAGFGAGAGRFAPEQDQQLPADVAAAYAAVTPYYKAPIAPAPKRWNVWAAAFGGSNNTSGDPNGVGSANFTARTGAVAAGVDYRLTPDTMIGVALAGGGTSWGLAQGLGSGHSDAFQAGLYGSQRFGAWYLSGAAAFANYWASTTRNLTLPAIDTLDANFNAQSWGGRLEGGYRFAWGTVNLTPYAAFQAQSFSTPNYSEASGSGSNQFALSYASRTGNIERAELGSWLNTLYLLQRNSVVSLFGRAAWAHDWQNTPQASATFLGLSPVASFIVNGAKPAADLGVVTAGAELRMASGWALMGKFDGEFGSGTQTYAGTARMRYVW